MISPSVKQLIIHYRPLDLLCECVASLTVSLSYCTLNILRMAQFTICYLTSMQ